LKKPWRPWKEGHLPGTRAIALEAERRMGEMLKNSELQKPGDHWKKKRLQEDTVIPSLSELGITKRKSADAQSLAEMPEEKKTSSLDAL